MPVSDQDPKSTDLKGEPLSTAALISDSESDRSQIQSMSHHSAEIMRTNY